MKPFLRLSLVVITALNFVACNKTASVPAASQPVTGDFVVSSFFSTSDQTAAFSSFILQFSADGSVSGVSSRGNINGRWIKDDHGHEFEIEFEDAPLNRLNGKWEIEIESNDDHFKLRHKDDDSDDRLELTRHD